jgi:hypothetical protein
VAYDPAHIPDCNVHATVGKHFLIHETILDDDQANLERHFWLGTEADD